MENRDNGGGGEAMRILDEEKLFFKTCQKAVQTIEDSDS
jgi:hypothetical protein